MPPKTEQQKFLESLDPPAPADPFAPPTTEPAPQGGGEAPKEPTAEEKFNRRERRLTMKLQAERESGIALAARLSTLSEAQRAQAESSPAEYLKAVEKIYGSESPEAVAATELLKTALKGVEERATENAVERIREEQRQEREAVSDEEKNLDVMVEEIEDEIGQDMDAQTRKGFFALLEKLSPKDRDGNITAYADHHAVWEEYQARKKPADTRQKDLAARSMVQAGASPIAGVEADANERWLRENGII